MNVRIKLELLLLKNTYFDHMADYDVHPPTPFVSQSVPQEDYFALGRPLKYQMERLGHHITGYDQFLQVSGRQLSTISTHLNRFVA